MSIRRFTEKAPTRAYLVESGYYRFYISDTIKTLCYTAVDHTVSRCEIGFPAQLDITMDGHLVGAFSVIVQLHR